MSIKLQPFFFVRHGRTAWNQRQLCQGHTDIPLDETGKREAEMLRHLLKNRSFPHVFSSPLLRAYETAKIAFPGQEIKLVDDLKERGWGQMEGVSSEAMYVVERKEEESPLFDPGLGIESRAAFKERIVRGINYAFDHSKGVPPLLVSHGRLFLVLGEILNIPPIRQIPNASLIECAPLHNRWQMFIHSSSKEE